VRMRDGRVTADPGVRPAHCHSRRHRADR
jgi:hypothetical protein